MNSVIRDDLDRSASAGTKRKLEELGLVESILHCIKKKKKFGHETTNILNSMFVTNLSPPSEANQTQLAVLS